MEKYWITADEARKHKSEAPALSMEETLQDILSSTYHEISEVSRQGGEALSFTPIGIPNQELLMPDVIKDLNEKGFATEMLYGDLYIYWK